MKQEYKNTQILYTDRSASKSLDILNMVNMAKMNRAIINTAFWEGEKYTKIISKIRRMGRLPKLLKNLKSSR